MPDAAFDATERQFLDLIRCASTSRPVEIALRTRCRASSAVPRYARVVAGAVPRSRRALGRPARRADRHRHRAPRARTSSRSRTGTRSRGLIEWAERATVSTVLSCLAAHAALLIFDGIERRTAPVQAERHLRQRRRAPAPAGRGPRTISCPCRTRASTTCRAALLEASGYAMLLGARDAGWAVAVKRRSRCLFVLCQGHLEYGTDSLLREYRRDVRRFLAGERSTYPCVPVELRRRSATSAGSRRCGRMPPTDPDPAPTEALSVRARRFEAREHVEATGGTVLRQLARPCRRGGAANARACLAVTASSCWSQPRD